MSLEKIWHKSNNKKRIDAANEYQQFKLTIEQKRKYWKNKIVWNGLETISHLIPNIFRLVSGEMKKSVKLASVKIPL